MIPKNETEFEKAWRQLNEAIRICSSHLELPEQKILLKNSFNKANEQLNKIFNPEDEWLKDKSFLDNFMLYEFAATDGKGMKHTQKLAAVNDLRKKTDNDIELAKEVLVLSAKYASFKFDTSIEEARKAVKIKKPILPQKQETSPINIQDFCKSRNITIIEIDEKRIRIEKTTLANHMKLIELAKTIKLKVEL